MIVRSSYNGIYERILWAKDGRLVRVQFIVAEFGGRFRGHIISVDPIELIVSIENRTQVADCVFLPATVNQEKAVPKAARKINATSHFSPLSSFEFFMSQPTRAPSRMY